MNSIFKSLAVVVIGAVLFSLPSCKKVVMGCMDVSACNYSDQVTEDNGSCTYPEENMDCTGGCVNDVDADGICDEDEIPGCVAESAFNYSADATDDDGSCVFAAGIMANTWNVVSECEGVFVGGFIPSEITITEGANEGDLVLDLGAGIVLNGTVDSEGNIMIPSQDVDLTVAVVTVNGNGQLNTVDSTTVYINFSSLLINDNCTLTLTL
ncbi:MAG: hypothetical protein H8D62_02145 [Bacteroidetes bacterium]|nr:hypothetical protein [Bacteroidota bacterium]